MTGGGSGKKRRKGKEETESSSDDSSSESEEEGTEGGGADAVSYPTKEHPNLSENEDEDGNEKTSGHGLTGNAGPQAVVGTASDIGAQFSRPSAGQSSSDPRAPSQSSGGQPAQMGGTRAKGATGLTRVDPTLSPAYRFWQSGWKNWRPEWEKVLTGEGEVPNWYTAIQEEVATSNRWRDAAFDRCDQARDDLVTEFRRNERFRRDRDFWKARATGPEVRLRDEQSYNRGVADGKREEANKARELAAVYGPQPTPGSGDGGGPPMGIHDSHQNPEYYSQHGGSRGRTHGNDRGGRDSGLRQRLTQPNVITLCPPPIGPYGRGRGGGIAWTRGSGATGFRDTRYSGEARAALVKAIVAVKAAGDAE